MSTRAIAIYLFLLVVLLWGSAFFIDLDVIDSPSSLFTERILTSDYIFGHNILSAILAGVSLLIMATSVFLFNKSFSTGINYMLPVLYLFLTLSNPYSVYLTPFHISCVFFILVFFYSSRYRVFNQQFKDLFLIFFVLSISSFFYAPTIWMFPVLLINNLRVTEDKFKYIVTSIVALSLPLIYFCGINYLINGWSDTVALLQQYGSQIINIEHKAIMLTAAEICKYILILISVLLSVFYVISHLDMYKIVKSKSYSRLLFYLFVLFLIMILFVSSNKFPFGIVLYFPISLLLYEYITDNAKKHIGIFLFVFALLFLAERIIYFIR